jgi:hypothetical protein
MKTASLEEGEKTPFQLSTQKHGYERIQSHSTEKHQGFKRIYKHIIPVDRTKFEPEMVSLRYPCAENREQEESEEMSDYQQIEGELMWYSESLISQDSRISEFCGEIIEAIEVYFPQTQAVNKYITFNNMVTPLHEILSSFLLEQINTAHHKCKDTLMEVDGVFPMWEIENQPTRTMLHGIENDMARREVATFAADMLRDVLRAEHTGW